MLTINTNVSSLTAQRNLSSSQSALSTSLQRLSSGLRINSAKDDAAGLAISERMTAQIRGLDVAKRNANDGISLSQTAEGALEQIGNNLQRIRELAVQSSNATNTLDDRKALDTEAQALKDEIDRVSTQTSFNGIKLLDGSFTNQDFQVGAEAGQTISVASIVNAQSSSLGVNTTATLSGVAATGFANAISAGDLTITGTTGTSTAAIDIGAIGAAATQQERVAQVMDAINKQSSLTGVSASIDSSSGNLILTSDGNFTIGGAGTAADIGINPAAGAVTATTTSGFGTLSLQSVNGATQGIKQMDAALKAVNTARASLGAIQNRFSSAISNLTTSSENLSASRSRIQDADFASETATLSRNQILQQAGTAMLAQANQLPQQVLKLLQ